MKCVATICLLAMLCGCSGIAPTREASDSAAYRQYAGPAVESFRTTGRILSWTPLGDDAVAVWTSSNQAWLLDVETPCPSLEFAHAIGLSESVGRVSARFDRVTPIGGGLATSCRIERIRPIDLKSMLDAARAAGGAR